MMRKIFATFVIFCVATLGACSGAKHMQVELPEKAPEEAVTNYSDALVKLGEMTLIFDPGHIIYVQSKDIVDKTGTSMSGKAGEIPYDITEMTQSAINRIGGKIGYVPYDPSYIENRHAYISTGLLPPEIVISGAITQYDRSTEVTGDSADFGGEFGAGGAFGADAGFSNKRSVSSISIDMNVIDFATMSMISQVQAVNSIKVYKGAKESDVGFSIFGQSFGLKGVVKKIQGRHAAVRTLVEMCVLECVGKFMDIPYWKCVDGAHEDSVVLKRRKRLFKKQNDVNRTWMIQRLMPAYGIEGIQPNGVYGKRTHLAMKVIADTYKTGSPALTPSFYIAMFKNAPFFEKPAFDVDKLNAKITALPVEAPQEVAAAEPVAVEPAAVESVANAQPAAAEPVAEVKTEVAKSQVQQSVQEQAPVQNKPANVVTEVYSAESYEAHMEAGKKAFASKDFATARDNFFIASKIGANLKKADPFIYLAYTYQGLGNTASVGKVLKLGLKYMPYSIPLYRVYIRHLISLNQLDEARDYLKQGLNVDPESKVLLSLKDYLKAVQK